MRRNAETTYHFTIRYNSVISLALFFSLMWPRTALGCHIILPIALCIDTFIMKQKNSTKKTLCADDFFDCSSQCSNTHNLVKQFWITIHNCIKSLWLHHCRKIWILSKVQTQIRSYKNIYLCVGFKWTMNYSLEKIFHVKRQRRHVPVRYVSIYGRNSLVQRCIMDVIHANGNFDKGRKKMIVYFIYNRMSINTDVVACWKVVFYLFFFELFCNMQNTKTSNRREKNLNRCVQELVIYIFKKTACR